MNKSWLQHPTRDQLYGHLPPITRTIQAKRTRHAGHCWRNKDELISDVLLWTPAYGRAKAGWPARKYIQQLCEDTGCSPEDLSEAMNDWENWREKVRDIRTGGTTWWWWWYSKIWTSRGILRMIVSKLISLWGAVFSFSFIFIYLFIYFLIHLLIFVFKIFSIIYLFIYLLFFLNFSFIPFLPHLSKKLCKIRHLLYTSSCNRSNSRLNAVNYEMTCRIFQCWLNRCFNIIRKQCSKS